MLLTADMIHTAQEPATQAMTIWREMAATKGLRIADPAAQMADPIMAHSMLQAAGFQQVEARPHLCMSVH